MTFMDTLRARVRLLKSWRETAPAIAKAARELLPDAEVYVFGSAVTGDCVASSDVDILIVSEQLPARNIERARIKVEIEEKAGLPPYHPFELHLTTLEEAEPYFRRARHSLTKL
ncbi:MAG: nucleotidyltransferase domain-containing protein [Candidatus Caldarchaeum sp.]